jgi:hypothetical protein
VTRWEGLFADLEAEAAALSTAQRAAEIEERARVEVGGLGLLDRARAAIGTTIRVRCVASASVAGTLLRVGADWLLVDEGRGREAVVPLGQVVEVSGLSRLAAPPRTAGVVESRLTLRHALRGLVRDRAAVTLTLRDGRLVTGTLDRVGADFVELAEHPASEHRRRGDVRDVVVVPLSALVLVRRT